MCVESNKLVLGKSFVFQRLPTVTQIGQVYATTLFLFSSWSMYHLFEKVPAWLNYMTLGEILSIFAYSYSVNLFESLIVVFSLVGLAVLLPLKWFRDVFVPVSVSFVFMLIAYLIFFLFQFFATDDYPSLIVKTAPVVVVCGFALASWFGRITIVRRVLEDFADRVTVFLYILLPLGGVSLIAVILQNLF